VRLFANGRLGWVFLGIGVCIAAANTGNAQTPQNPASSRDIHERQTVAVELRPQLFATLCALDVAGFNADVGGSPGRIQLRQRLHGLHGPAVEAVRKFYSEHALGDASATFSRFVSFGLAAGPPPRFEFELRKDELPPDALALEGFNQILANFYREERIDQLWEHYLPEYQATVESLNAPVSQIVFTASNYLREIVRPDTGRAFSVYVEPLAGGKTNFRNYGDHYEMVVGYSSDSSLDDIRHAFLHFLLDPMVIRYRVQAAKTSPVLEYAARAPRLPLEYRDDVSAFFDECLVRAVELRLRKLSPAALSGEIDQAEGAGFVLVRPIYAGLTGFEKAEPAMSYALPDLIKGINVDAEQRRLRAVKFSDAVSTDAKAADAAGAEQPATATGTAGVASGAGRPASPAAETGDLAEGHRQILARNGPAAAAAFQRVLAANPNDYSATYGLAVASALMGDPGKARELFSKIIAAAQTPSAHPGAAQPDPTDVSWAHIYLGRMYDVEGQRELAVAEYRSALSVDGAQASARAAAQRGVDAGYETPSREGEKKPDGKS
jgi:tetratricopeptide (TPR) repeat protein